MNVNSLSNISDAYVQSIISSTVDRATGNTNAPDASSLTLPQDGSAQLSPFARILSTLQTLQQSDPARYQQITSQIATNLQSAAQTAEAGGNSSQASELNQLASDFTNASQNNALPNVQDLAPLAGAHGHHHRHMHPATSDSDNTAATNTSSTTTSSSSGSTTGLSQWISQFLVNSTSPTQNNPLSPFSIISDTLSQAGL